MSGGDLTPGGQRDRDLQAMAVDPERFRIVQTPSMRGGLGPHDLSALAELAPPDRSAGPRLPVPEGWVELNVRGPHQTLMLAGSGRHRGICAQIGVTVAAADVPGAEATAPGAESGPGPDDLVLAVERWSGGEWRGVHSAWLRQSPGGTVQHRLWEIPAEGGLRVDISAQYTAAVGLHLDHRVDALVARLEMPDAGPRPADADLAEALFQDRRARRQLPAPVPDPITLGPAGADWIERLPQLAEVSRGRLDVAPPPAPADVVSAGLAQPDGSLTAAGQRISRTRSEARARVVLYRSDARGTTAAGQLWLDEDRVLAISAATSPAAPHRAGLYVRAQAAELILRMIGFVPEGPHPAPEPRLSWEQLVGSAPASGTDPAAHPWWTSPRVLWQVVPQDPDAPAVNHAAVPGEGTGEALQVLTVPDFGHYRCLAPSPDAPGRFRLEMVSGLALLQQLRDWCRGRAADQ